MPAEFLYQLTLRVLHDNKSCNKYMGNYSQDCHGKAAFYKKEDLSTNKMDLNLGKKLVKWHILSISFYGVQTVDTSEISDIPGKSNEM